MAQARNGYAVVDLDGDGVPELATQSEDQETWSPLIQTWRPNASGGFAEALRIAGGDEPRFLAQPVPGSSWGAHLFYSRTASTTTIWRTAANGEDVELGSSSESSSLDRFATFATPSGSGFLAWDSGRLLLAREHATDAYEFVSLGEPELGEGSNPPIAVVATDGASEGELRVLLAEQHLVHGAIDLDAGTADFTRLEGLSGEHRRVTTSAAAPGWVVLDSSGPAGGPPDAPIELCRLVGGGSGQLVYQGVGLGVGLGEQLGAARLIARKGEAEPDLLLVPVRGNAFVYRGGESTELTDWEETSYVAVVDLDGDGQEEVVVGSAAGPTPLSL